MRELLGHTYLSDTLCSFPGTEYNLNLQHLLIFQFFIYFSCYLPLCQVSCSVVPVHLRVYYRV